MVLLLKKEKGVLTENKTGKLFENYNKQLSN